MIDTMEDMKEKVLADKTRKWKATSLEGVTTLALVVLTVYKTCIYFEARR